MPGVAVMRIVLLYLRSAVLHNKDMISGLNVKTTMVTASVRDCAPSPDHDYTAMAIASAYRVSGTHVDTFASWSLS